MIEKNFEALGWQNYTDWLKWTFATSMALFFFSMTLTGTEFLASAILAWVVPFAVLYSVPAYINLNRVARMEEELSDALFFAAGLSNACSLEDIIEEIATSDMGEVSKEFSKASKQISAGMPVEAALQQVIERNRSQVIERCISLILVSFDAGVDVNEVLKEAALELSDIQEIARERNSMASLERYTLLFAGGIIVPFILGSLTGMVQSLNLGMMSMLGSSMSEIARRAIIDNAILGNKLYIAENALLASAFLAMQDSAPVNFLKYSVFLLPVSLLVFFLASS